MNGEFPPVERTVPIFGTHPETGEEKVWACPLVWQAVSMNEITMTAYGPFGQETVTRETVFDALASLRIQLEFKQNYDPPFRVLTKGARKDVYHVGHIVSRFPGDHAEVLVQGRKPTQTVDVLADIDPDEMTLLGSVVAQQKHFMDYMDSLRSTDLSARSAPTQAVPPQSSTPEFPPVERMVPIRGTDPTTGQQRVWMCRIVWQAVTTNEVVMTAHGPFGERTSRSDNVFQAFKFLRWYLEMSQWYVLTKGARKDVYHAGLIVSHFPGDHVEIVLRGQPVTQAVDILAPAELHELPLLGSVPEQLDNFFDFMSGLDAETAPKVLGDRRIREP